MSSDGSHPRCGRCGVLMRDTPGGYRCPPRGVTAAGDGADPTPKVDWGRAPWRREGAPYVRLSEISFGRLTTAISSSLKRAGIRTP